MVRVQPYAPVRPQVPKSLIAAKPATLPLPSRRTTLPMARSSNSELEFASRGGKMTFKTTFVPKAGGVSQYTKIPFALMSREVPCEV